MQEYQIKFSVDFGSSDSTIYSVFLGGELVNFFDTLDEARDSVGDGAALATAGTQKFALEDLAVALERAAYFQRALRGARGTL